MNLDILIKNKKFKKTKKKKLFISLDLGLVTKKSVKKFLDKTLYKKHWPVKWVDWENLHLTLAYLGWIEINRKKIKLLYSILKKASSEVSPFVISFKNLGCFPNFQKPRVLWLGLKGDLKTLSKLQKTIAREILGKKEMFGLEELVLKSLQRPFSSHITLGRIKKNVKHSFLIEIGKQVKKFPVSSFQFVNLKNLHIKIDKLVIYQSVLKKQKIEYKKLKEVFL